MITYQDYLQSSDKISFIYQAIKDFQNSEIYTNSIKSRSYYKGENPTINKRMNWIYSSRGEKVEDKFRANNKLSSEFLSYIVNQLNSYLLGNGLFVDEEIKKGLGKRFDTNLFKLGINSQLDSVAWIYCYIDNKGNFSQNVFNGNEFIPLYDEITSDLMAGIRYWQLDTDKPMMVEFYERDGKSTIKYGVDEGIGQVIQDKKPYIVNMNYSETFEEITDSDNWSVIPVFPLFYNDKNSGVLTKGLRSYIDAYDVVNSDLVNNLEDNNDIYAILKNYPGESLEEFLTEFKMTKTIRMESDAMTGDSSAEIKQIEVPYQARKEALTIIRNDIFKNSMALDAEKLTGNSLTNVAIKASMINLDLKADLFEMNVIDCVDNIINLYLEFVGKQNEEYNIKFARRTLVNETEEIDNLLKIRDDLDLETFLHKLPNIDNEEIEKIVKNKEEEVQKTFSFEEPFRKEEEIKIDEEGAE